MSGREDVVLQWDMFSWPPPFWLSVANLHLIMFARSYRTMFLGFERNFDWVRYQAVFDRLVVTDKLETNRKYESIWFCVSRLEWYTHDGLALSFPSVRTLKELWSRVSRYVWKTWVSNGCLGIEDIILQWDLFSWARYLWLSVVNHIEVTVSRVYPLEFEPNPHDIIFQHCTRDAVVYVSADERKRWCWAYQ